MRQILRTLFWGALIFSALIFIIVPMVFGVNVKDIISSPKWDAVAEPWRENPLSLNPNKNAENVQPQKSTDSDQDFIRKDRIIYIPIVIVSILIIGYLAYYLFMRSRNKVLASQLIYYKAIPFGDFELADMAVAQGFLRSLAQNMRQPWDAVILGQPWFRYIIKKNAGDGLVELFFGIPEDRTEPFLNSFAGYYNKVQLIKMNKAEANEIIPEKKNYKVSTFSLLTKDPLPIRVFEGKAGEPDPINIILNGVGGGKPSDIDIIIDIILKPVSESTHLYKVGSKYIAGLKDSRSDVSDIPNLLAGGDNSTVKKQKTMSEFEKDYLKAVKDRSTAPEKAFSTSIRLYATGDGKDDLLMALKSASDGFSSLNALNSLVSEPVLDTWRMKKKIEEGRLGIKEGFILSTSELMSFVRIPDNTLDAFSMIGTIDAKAIRAPQSIRSEDVAHQEMFLVDMDDPDSVMNEYEQGEDDMPLGEIPITEASQKPIILDDSDMGFGDDDEMANALEMFENQIKQMQANPEPKSEPVAEGPSDKSLSEDDDYEF